VSTPSDNKFRPHILTGGGMPQGYKFRICTQCGKHGVSSRVFNSQGRAIALKVCKYCGWGESLQGTKEVRK